MAFHLKPVCGEDFVDREAILSDLLSFLEDPGSTDGVCLYGLRRMGKTSLMLKIIEKLQETKKIVPVYFTLWDLSVRQIDFFSNALVNAILEAYAPKAGVKEKIGTLFKESKKWVSSILKAFKLSVEIAEDVSTVFSFEGFKEKKSADDLVELPFRLAENLSEIYSCKTALFLDEFPDLIDFEFGGKKLGVPVVGKIRSILERSRRVTLSIAGSTRRTMKLVAVDEASPFYRQFVLRELGPFDREAVLKLLERNLKRPLHQIEKLADWLMENTSGIPFYIQCLGRIIDYTGIDPVNKGEVLWRSFLEEEAPLIYRAEIEELSNSERRILDAISSFDTFTFAMVQNNVGKAVSNVGQWLGSLVDKGVLLNPERGSYQFTDPVFRRYLNFSKETN